ncbi:nucleoporin NUP188 homolog, partial [Elysia marginata]
MLIPFQLHSFFQDIFEKFLTQILDQNLLGKKLSSQLEEVCQTPIPTKDLNGPLMGRAQVLLWAHQNLREQAEVLELLLIYYNNFVMDVPTLLDFCQRFKKHDFGWGQSYKHLVDGIMEKTVQRIGYLEVLLLLEGFDLITAADESKQN